MKLKLTVFCLGFVFFVNSQDIKRFIYGFNAGVKFANKSYAVRYTGVYQDQLKNYFDNPIHYQAIYQLLNDTHFSLIEYSELYRYKPSPVYGVNIGYQASPNLTFEGDLNFSNLTMIGGYTLELVDPGNFTSQDIYKTGHILGKESRFNGRLSINYTGDGDKFKVIAGLSALFNAWRMESNKVELNGSILTDLYSQFNPNNSFYTKTRGTGLGYGINIGFQYPIQKGISMQVMYQPYVSRMDYFNTKNQIESIGNSYNKPKLKLENDLIVRFVLR